MKKMELYINILSMLFLAMSIIMFEIGYNKRQSKIFYVGVELLIVAIYIILFKHFFKVFNYTIENYIQFGLCIVVAYYIAKIGILYTKKRNDVLKSMSDIREIVKEEHIKKETRRKNLKK